jgi:hypothetical protein
LLKKTARENVQRERKQKTKGTKELEGKETHACEKHVEEMLMCMRKKGKKGMLTVS